MNFQEIWAGRNEELVQKCLEEAFIKKGYRVLNNHLADRSHENGVDLVCENCDDKIHIQVKMKPKSSDIEQLEILSKSESNKKIYVFVEDPVVAFSSSIKNHKNVEFWNKEKLHEFLIENNCNTYLRIFFLSLPLIRGIVDSLYDILKYSKVKPRQLENDQLAWWWVFKDRTVKLHNSFQLLKDIYQTELLEKDIENVEDIKSYIKKMSLIFSYIDDNSGRDLKNIIKTMGEKFPQVLSHYLKITIGAGRSNFIGMPGSLDYANVRELIENWVLPKENESTSYYNQIVFYLDNLEKISDAIEDGVDWVFENKFGNQDYYSAPSGI